MDPQVPASFIPKKPLDTGGPSRLRGESAYGSILFLLSLLIFIASAVAGGGVFAYQAYLQSQITAKSAQLTAAEGAFDPSVITQLVRLDSRINNAQTLLQAHVAPSGIFTLLSADTLQNVTFDSLDFELQQDGSADVTLTGTADSFATLALQSDQFGATQGLKDIVFSGITVNSGGGVTFTMKAIADPSLINYAKNLNSLSGTAPTTAPVATSSVQVATSTRQ